VSSLALPFFLKTGIVARWNCANIEVAQNVISCDISQLCGHESGLEMALN
jgi:hypothetical protein